MPRGRSQESGNRSERAQAISLAIANSVQHLLQKNGDMDESQKINMRIGAAIIKQATPKQVLRAIEESILMSTTTITPSLHVHAKTAKGA